MIRSLAAALVALVVGFAVPVHADSLSGTLSGDSTLTPSGTLGIFVQNFTGDGDDSVFGSFTPQSQSTIDFSHPPDILVSDGTFLETFSQGTLFGTSSGGGTVSGHGTATITLDFVITGGSGLFAGDTGEATVTGTLTSTSATTESFTGSYTGSLTAAFPEPSSFVLLAPAAVVVFCRRRRGRLAG